MIFLKQEVDNLIKRIVPLPDKRTNPSRHLSLDSNFSHAFFIIFIYFDIDFNPIYAILDIKLIGRVSCFRQGSYHLFTEFLVTSHWAEEIVIRTKSVCDCVRSSLTLINFDFIFYVLCSCNVSPSKFVNHT